MGVTARGAVRAAIVVASIGFALPLGVASARPAAAGTPAAPPQIATQDVPVATPLPGEPPPNVQAPQPRPPWAPSGGPPCKAPALPIPCPPAGTKIEMVDPDLATTTSGPDGSKTITFDSSDVSSVTTVGASTSAVTSRVTTRRMPAGQSTAAHASQDIYTYCILGLNVPQMLARDGGIGHKAVARSSEACISNVVVWMWMYTTIERYISDWEALESNEAQATAPGAIATSAEYICNHTELHGYRNVTTFLVEISTPEGAAIFETPPLASDKVDHTCPYP